jgi:hypothetical protein
MFVRLACFFFSVGEEKKRDREAIENPVKLNISTVAIKIIKPFLIYIRINT